MDHRATERSLRFRSKVAVGRSRQIWSHRTQRVLGSMLFEKLRIGEYPPEYNPTIHGPYDPARWYGKPDTPFGQVKIGELLPWLSRRNKSPLAIGRALSRAWWRWEHKYTLPKRGSMAPYYQIIVGAMVFFYAINYGKIKQHRNYKYH